MWLFTSFPKISYTRDTIPLRQTTSSTNLRLATMRIGGGSGSFVSPNGLVFTNDHVASDCISKLGSAQHNYMRDGFYAATQQEEIACPDLEANVLLNVDGNIESLPLTYLYSDDQARAVHVASQGIIEALRKLYKTPRLLHEIGVPGNVAAAPPSALLHGDVRALRSRAATGARCGRRSGCACPSGTRRASCGNDRWSRPTTCGPAAASRCRRRSSRLCGVGRQLVFSSISALLHLHGQNSILQLCACSGESAAIDVGRPMCRRSVPISTTSSSPFLNSPTSPLAANGSCSRTS